MSATVRDICLKRQLYGRAKDLCENMKEDIFLTVKSVKHMIVCIYQRDAISFVSETYRIFNELLNCRRGTDFNL